MKPRFLSLTAVAAFTFFATGCGDSDGPKEVAKETNEERMEDTPRENMMSDADWAVDAASGGMMEVQLGELAQKNAASQAVKDFGRMMATEHSKANAELKEMASRKNIALPAALGESHQEKYEELSGKTGKDFDEAYMSFMVDDHQEDIDAYQKEAENGNDVDIKAFAAKTVPTLQQHLEMAKQTRDAVTR